ncbi:gamma-mobile-trio protein GmtX [Paraburkholderia guartelaensis]|uniref:gamma-mobile-trio protein GmtX n=1 Tax=Paraburkholderia guartelaensis TaxID=2546446 RepID=UPI003CCC621C
MCLDSSPRTERSLRLIYLICEEQHERGSRDFSVATIGRLSAERNGPSAAAIRNRTGEQYRALMKAYANSVGGRSRKSVTSKPDRADEILEGIPDPVLRIRINLMLADIESLRAQLLAARHLANTTSTVRIESAHAAPPNVGPHRSDPGLSMIEVRALKAALSDRTLEHWGWTLDQEGRVCSETGQVVFQAGFATAITKILALCNKSD